MKLATNTNEITGNMVFSKREKMEIEASASGIILDSLIRLYQNPYVAALREYSSNAWDSHQEAGQTLPIEISLPTRLSPVLVIEDFGMGMSRTQLSSYGKFGFSTKRDDNDNIGGFGLGSKVGLAFSSQYTVQAVKDGYKNIVIIGRDADGNPEMGFINGPQIQPGTSDAEHALVENAYLGEPTDLPNGVKITIPTSEVHKFSEALNKNFFLGFAPNAIKVDGQFSPYSVHNTDQFETLGDGLGWRRAKGAQQNVGGVALIKGVRYLIDWSEVSGDIDYALRTGYLTEVVINLENGAVDIQRSRESLVYSKRTREVLVAKLEALMTYATKQFATDIAAAPSFREALQIRRKAVSFGFPGPYTWGGKPIDLNLTQKDNRRDLQFTTSTIGYGTSKSGYQTNRDTLSLRTLLMYNLEKVYAENLHTVLVVGASDPTEVRNRTLHVESNGTLLYAQDAADNGVSHKANIMSHTYYFTSAKGGKLPVWFKNIFSEVIEASDYMDVVLRVRKDKSVAAAVVRKANMALKVSTGLVVRKVEFFGDGRSNWGETKASDLDTTKTHVLLQATNSGGFNDQMIASLMTQMGKYNTGFMSSLAEYMIDRYNVVFLYATKTINTSKYAAEVPNMILGADFPAFMEKTAKALVAKKTELEKRAILDTSAGNARWTMNIPDRLIPDIKLKSTREWVTAMKKKDVNSKENFFLTTVSTNGIRMGIDGSSAKIATIIESPAQQYKLMTHLAGWSVDYNLVVGYLNMIDAAEGRI